MKLLTAAGLLLLGASAAVAAPAPATGGPPQRVSTLVVYGNDSCPQSQGDEIVVCARQPESERYRVPKRFRGKKPLASQGSWASTARDLEYVGRSGLPNSCSVNGSNGQTGCFQQFLRQAREEREQARRDASGVP